MPVVPLGELLTETPLYAPMEIKDEDKSLMINLRRDNIQVDCFCLRCERETVYKTMRIIGSGAGRPTPPKDWMFRNGYISPELFCARCGYAIVTEFSVRDRILTKWGQLPSVADLSGAELRTFRNVLSRNDYSELNRAVGLISHGVGIGSFVYLRRIFERLVSKYATEARERGMLSEEFDTLRMGEKIDSLKDFLPRAVYEYRDAYSILSRGIHELSENDCTAAYPIIFAAVRLMLEEEVHKREREKAEADLKKQFQAIKSGLSDVKRGS
ncbi:hypothetical protein [uncultured Jannaschia sp.]|uniref:hypothetical protein n=1 Tax=uncultured Jannaschia sp. TaxID=293347 RepID=UPI002602A1CA|nr:hypothetical protein [uncultured Jannaschia sp.]